MKPITVATVHDLDALLPRASGGRFLLGITGAPGAGKSTAAAAVAGLDDGRALVPMDGFHLADKELQRQGLLDRKGSPETFDAHGYAALLTRLRRDRTHTVYAPSFERALEQPLANALPVPPAVSLVITEGNYLLLDSPGWREARLQLDAVWFVDVDPGLRRHRLVERHMAFGKSPQAAEEWVQRIDDANAALVDATRVDADLVLDCSEWQLP